METRYLGQRDVNVRPRMLHYDKHKIIFYPFSHAWNFLFFNVQEHQAIVSGPDLHYIKPLTFFFFCATANAHCTSLHF